MPVDLATKVRVYAAMVQNLQSYDDELEAEAPPIWRDSIQKALDLAEGISPESATLLRQGDELLMAQRESLIQRFLGIFRPERTAEIPKGYWWWHIERGPEAHVA